MRIQLIINGHAGRLVGADAASIADLAADTLQASGHEVVVSVVAPEQLPQALDAARKAGPEVLIVGGGDGTARAAASAIVGSATALGILPLGTINKLARDLGVPLDHKAAVETLARGHIRAIDVAEVNGRLFLCNALLGLTTRFSVARQNLRGKAISERLRGYFSTVSNLLRWRRRLVIHVDDGSRRRRLRVLSLAVTNNACADEGGLAMRRADLAGGTLGVYASQHQTGWRMALAALRAVSGTLKGDGNLVQLLVSRLSVDVRGRRFVAVSIDGEVETLATPLVFSILPGRLNVLVPAQTQG